MSLLLYLLMFPPSLLADDAERFFDSSCVHEIHITFQDADWYDTLFSAYIMGDDNLYLPCRWEYIESTSTVVVDPIGARFKGNSSFFDSGLKKSLKIDFNEIDSELSFLGLKKLNLNNNFQDPTMLRESLFLGFLADRTPIHRCSFARVYINGEYWGLFTAAEQIDGNFCERMYGDSEDGNLYKGENQADLTYLGDDPASYFNHYEKKTNEDLNDWMDLVSFISTLNQTPSSTLPSILPTIIDYDSLVDHFAANILFINLDAYLGPAHNYYLYHRDDNGRFAHLIWDCNMAFGNYTLPFPESFNMVEVPLLWRDSNGSDRPLADRLWESPILVRDHYRALARMLRTGFDSETMDARIDEMANLIRADVYADTKKEYTNEEFEMGLTSDVGRAVGLKRFVSDRRVFVKNSLDALALRSDLRLNELMPANVHSTTDESGDHDPWIELFNLGPGLVNTSQMYLTNDSANPSKWLLPSNSIDDAQFLVIWLDGEPGEGANHASFRLESSGGELFLFLFESGQYELVDSTTYPAMTADAVWGRYPDGTGDWSFLRSATTGSTNALPVPPDVHLFINEFIAANDMGYIDEQGEYEDWLEIYNAGSESINLAGLYLTDTLSNPTKWRIPSLEIAAGGFLVFFCDEDQEQGDRHTNFKLSQGGESIGLFSFDGVTALDTVTYDEQTANISYGRCPDGGTSWRFLGTGSPGASNNTMCDSNGMILSLDDRDLIEGDRFHLHFSLSTQDTADSMDAYLLLGVGSMYWCWPSWRSLDEGLDGDSFAMAANEIKAIEVLNFDWTGITGSASGLYFYGAAFQQGTFDLIGNIQAIEFGYYE